MQRLSAVLDKFKGGLILESDGGVSFVDVSAFCLRVFARARARTSRAPARAGASAGRRPAGRRGRSRGRAGAPKGTERRPPRHAAAPAA